MTQKLQPLALSLQFAKEVSALHRQTLKRHRVMRWMRHALADAGAITVRVVGEEEGRMLNQTYRNKNYATNVLTFHYAKQPVVEADLVLCAPVVEAEAAALNKPLGDHYTHLIVHGTLHAQGWDHETSPEDAAAMENQERLILRKLGLDDPYAQGY